jgi:hypothetical protein
MCMYEEKEKEGEKKIEGDKEIDKKSNTYTIIFIMYM